MTERKSPTAVLHEGPRALTDAQVREIEESDLAGVLNVDIDDVIEYVHKDLKSLPDFTTLYRKYLKQRWDVYDLDFTQDKIDWQEKMTEEERQSFIAVASGFHHGERQVAVELAPLLTHRFRGCPRRSSRRSGCWRTRLTSFGSTRTTSGRGCATAPTTSCGSRACSRCRS